jgi:hypothetical protein
MRRWWVLAGALAAAGCASEPANAPAWYTARERAIESGYPSLHSVPRTITANTDAAHWGEVQADVVQAGQAMRADPRAQWAPADDPNVFVAEARAVLERTRLAHEH